MSWGDRAIGVALGLILGIIAVVLFVFGGGQDTIDAPSLDHGSAPLERQSTGPVR